LTMHSTVKQVLEAEAPPNAADITIAQLLTHSSGLGDFFNAKFQAQRDRIRDVRDYLPLFAEDTPAFRAGTGWRYSNAGYILLGRMIEVAVGGDFFEYIGSAVFGRAGMTATAYLEADQAVPRVATGYTQFVRNPHDEHFTFRLGRITTNRDVQPRKGA